jgi:hypothetical protein
LIVDPKVIEWDYRSNPDEAPDKRLEYMLGYQLSRMCRESGAVRHDDRADALAMAVRWYTDALALSAEQAQVDRRQLEFDSMQEMFLEDPQRALDALCLGIGHHELLSARRGRSRPHSWFQGSALPDIKKKPKRS